MKKLKKLKILEEGRMCSPEELKKIRGGCSSGYTGCNKYSSCGLISLVSCNPSAAYGYESDGSGTNCASGYSYSSCCSLFSKYFSCGGGSAY
ncbi:hypothetical protein [Dysgonomonas sp. ZJ709]|uniref:hypothetical protein n=1 Tax=Dysgonomonas sp. ZJ709 TaxID=2709797 RepID=UPI0013EC36D4|nr:hypothetical protein [Dysgonomonas sp. ZJ709]